MNQTTKNIVSRIFMLTGLICFLVLTIASKSAREKMPMRGFDINIDHSKGCFFINEEQTEKIIYDFIDTNTSVINIREIEDLESYLNSLSLIETANVYLDNNSRLAVNINQREPVVRMFKNGATSFYVDKNGIKFPVQGNYTIKVPIVTGRVDEKELYTGELESPVLNDVLTLVNYIDDNSFWKSQIAQINVNENGELELHPRLGKQEILFGSISNVEEKLENLEIFYKEAIDMVKWDEYEKINLKYKDQIICTK